MGRWSTCGDLPKRMGKCVRRVAVWENRDTVWGDGLCMGGRGIAWEVAKTYGKCHKVWETAPAYGRPKKRGFETGSWQMDMVTEMIRKEFDVTVRARTLRRWLRRIGFSWRKDRYVLYRPVSKEGQEEFKREVGERAAQKRAGGMTVFAEDEAAVQRSQNPAYGRRPTGDASRSGQASQGSLSGYSARCPKTSCE